MSEPYEPQNRLDALFDWGAKTLVPQWCQTPEHWTSRVLDYVFVDCACCLLARGVVIGGMLGAILGSAVLYGILTLIR